MDISGCAGCRVTNNRAERSLRFFAMYCKLSFGTRQECEERFIEHIISLRQTCRIQTRRTYPVLVDTFRTWLQRSSPDFGAYPASDYENIIEGRNICATYQQTNGIVLFDY